jgi:hypothetical protein
MEYGHNLREKLKTKVNAFCHLMPFVKVGQNSTSTYDPIIQESLRYAPKDGYRGKWECALTVVCPTRGISREVGIGVGLHIN